MSGFLSKYYSNLDDIDKIDYEYVLITYTQNKIILFNLGEALKKVQAHKTLIANNIGILISVFYNAIMNLIAHKTKPENFLEKLIFHRNNSNTHENTKVVNPYVWSNWGVHYLGYYENYNYNKINILKRNSGQVFAEDNVTIRYNPLYLNKEFIYTINLRAKFSSRRLYDDLVAYLRHDNLAYGIENKLFERRIFIVFQFIKKAILYQDPHLMSSFLSSDTVIASKVAIIKYNIEDSHYEIYENIGVTGDPEMAVLILYLMRYRVYRDRKSAKKWFHKFRAHIVKNKDNLQIYEDIQIFTNLYQRRVNKTICLRYIETGFNNDKGAYRFGIIAPQSVINESKVDKMSNIKKLADEMLNLLKGKKYSQLGALHYVNRDTGLNYRCVFIY